MSTAEYVAKYPRRLKLLGQVEKFWLDEAKSERSRPIVLGVFREENILTTIYRTSREPRLLAQETYYPAQSPAFELARRPGRRIDKGD
jgi:hypothetical protein